MGESLSGHLIDSISGATIAALQLNCFTAKETNFIKREESGSCRQWQ